MGIYGRCGGKRRQAMLSIAWSIQNGKPRPFWADRGPPVRGTTHDVRHHRRHHHHTSQRQQQGRLVTWILRLSLVLSIWYHVPLCSCPLASHNWLFANKPFPSVLVQAGCTSLDSLAIRKTCLSTEPALATSIMSCQAMQYRFHVRISKTPSSSS